MSHRLPSRTGEPVQPLEWVSVSLRAREEAHKPMAGDDERHLFGLSVLSGPSVAGGLPTCVLEGGLPDSVC